MCCIFAVQSIGYVAERRSERPSIGGVPGSGVTACGSEVFAVVALQGLHGGREVGGSSEIFGKVGVATLQPNHEEDPDDPRQDAVF